MRKIQSLMLRRLDVPTHHIDSPARQRNLQWARNHGETYHQLRDDIACAHGAHYRVHSRHDQEIWTECSRLIDDAVVYYKALIMSEVLKRLSPSAFQHINLYVATSSTATSHRYSDR